MLEERVVFTAVDPSRERDGRDRGETRYPEPVINYAKVLTKSTLIARDRRELIETVRRRIPLSL